MIRLCALVLTLICACASAAFAVTCETRKFEGVPFSLCRVDAGAENLRLFLNDKDGELLGQFSSVDDALEEEGLKLSFAMNAGMYHPDRRPVGHYLEPPKPQNPMEPLLNRYYLIQETCPRK